MRTHRTTQINAPSAAPPEKDPVTAISRRQFLLRNLALGGAVALGQGVLAESDIQVSRHKLRLTGLKEPVRLIQLSDFHRSWCVSQAFLDRVVVQANALKPDVALLTGDFVTRSSNYMSSCIHSLRRLQTRSGSFAVLGNHDYACDAFSGGPRITEALQSIQITTLTNRSARLENGLNIVGIDDCWLGAPDPEAAFRAVRTNEPAIAMTHNPGYFPALGGYNCVTLAGHTHGGQINIPLLTRSLMARRARYLKGWFRSPEGPGRMYVSRGLGVVGIPLRLRCDPEIVLFELQPA
jgi:predicted MPP superfamily phosphohydrolase